MARVSGRSDDMLIIRGVNVFPSQVESVLLMSQEVAPHYRLVVERKGSLDMLEVQVEVTPEVYKEAKDAMLSARRPHGHQRVEALIELKKQIKKNIKDIIGITVEMTFKEPGSIERSEGKAKRVIDKRPKA